MSNPRGNPSTLSPGNPRTGVPLPPHRVRMPDEASRVALLDHLNALPPRARAAELGRLLAVGLNIQR